MTDEQLKALQERNAERAVAAREALGERLVTHPANAPKKRDGRPILSRIS